MDIRRFLEIACQYLLGAMSQQQPALATIPLRQKR